MTKKQLLELIKDFDENEQIVAVSTAGYVAQITNVSGATGIPGCSEGTIYVVVDTKRFD